ncbi:DUF4942 domain-containing protein, partial [Raoultella ornithinolytica]|uniref:DUF4942 domain-containing protein n=1 Tax=Raoultella ornithinolytica TaxID=54291 RepID=UPI00403D74B6
LLSSSVTAWTVTSEKRHLHRIVYRVVYEDELFRINYFQKGSAHIAFKRPELIERLNDIIARHYPGMLA